MSSADQRNAGAGARSDSNVSNHYEAHSASSYERAFFYSEGEYTTWLCNLVRTKLGMDGTAKDVKPTNEERRRVLVDLGGGTGNFTAMIIAGRQESLEAIVIDPFLPASSSAAAALGAGAGDRLRFVKAAAEEFIPSPAWGTESEHGSAEVRAWKTGYDYVLLKEVVHHFASHDRARIFAGLRNGLNPRGSEEEERGRGAALLIVTRPQREIDYPLWPAAREVWAAHQPSVEDIEADLRRAGFRDVEHSVHPFPCRIALDTWLGMVKNRFWSTFSKFTDADLADGCARIAKESPPDGVLKFEERLVFIGARH